MAKHLCVAYLLWLVGGFLGLHHFYLGRDRHAFVWFCTLGGIFGCGWIRDFFRIPEYVDDANDEEDYLYELRHRMKMDSKPPFDSIRFIGELVVGMLFGFLVRTAIPEDLMQGKSPFQILTLVVPYAVAVGVYTVGNIGREMASMRIALIGAYLGLPLLWANPGNITYVAVLSAIAVKAKGTRWRDQRPQRHLCVRAGVLLLCGVLYLSLWTSAIYHNSYIRLKDGQTVKVHVAVKNFFNSPAWAETKETLGKLWEHLSSRGFSGLYDEFMLAIDPEGEHHAHRVLGVRSSAGEQEITTAYRKLVKEWHPDKNKDPEMKEKVSLKFMEIQKAYETLSSIKARRAKQNLKQPSRANGEL